jgi:hypothetical protein
VLTSSVKFGHYSEMVISSPGKSSGRKAAVKGVVDTK